MKKSTIIALVVALVLVIALTVANSVSSKNQEAESTTVEVKKETVNTVKAAQYEAVDKGEKAETFKVETDLYTFTFDTKGGSVKSIMLKDHANADGQHVDIVFKGEGDNNAFLSYWGTNTDAPILENFAYSKNNKKVTFTKTFLNENGKEFTLEKVFELKDTEYMIKVSVNLSGNVPKNVDYYCALGYEPQVGPSFTSIKNNNYDYRRFYAGMAAKNGKIKRNTVKLSSDNTFVSTKDFKWFNLTSKYFTVIAYPEDQNAQYTYLATRSSGDISQTDSFYIATSKENTTIYYYCGPQLKQYLKSYYSGTDNAWGLRNANLDDAMESGSVFGWLENLLKWCLTTIHKVVPNYGIAIIILTIILKFALWPLQKKSMASTAKMSTLTPQVNAIKDKYPDNPQKQNEAMQALYKENNVNPMGGCLPLLIQFPILIAFYGLLNKHFELRGAMFIPGWIPDLSVPETVATLGFNLPLLGNEIHLLPIIYTVSMIFSMRMSQNGNQSKDQQTSMAMMTYGMPIMFFFVLYSAPSGLLLYWTVQNGLQMIQQMITNKKIAKGIDVYKSKKKNATPEKKEPEAVRKYQEKLRKLEEAKALAEKEKNNRK